MKYLVVTLVDPITGIPCHIEPMQNGATVPNIEGFTQVFDNHSTWRQCAPTELRIPPPRFYGTCPDDVDNSISGILEIITETSFSLARAEETLNLAIQALTRSVQLYLDRFAIERGYDNIISACSYATSGNAEFAADAARCIALRDATWIAVNAVFAAAKAGTRTLPQTYAELALELPALTWN